MAWQITGHYLAPNEGRSTGDRCGRGRVRGSAANNLGIPIERMRVERGKGGPPYPIGASRFQQSQSHFHDPSAWRFQTTMNLPKACPV